MTTRTGVRVRPGHAEGLLTVSRCSGAARVAERTIRRQPLTESPKWGRRKAASSKAFRLPEHGGQSTPACQAGRDFSGRRRTVARQEVAQGSLSGLDDPNSRRDRNLPAPKTVVSKPKAACGRSEIAAVIAGPGNAESCSTGGPGRSSVWVSLCRRGPYAAGLGHGLDARNGFERSKKHTARAPFRLARDIQAVVIAVDEINVGVARRARRGPSCGESFRRRSERQDRFCRDRLRLRRCGP